MNEETTILEKPKTQHQSSESVVWGVSIRGWIVSMVMATLCIRELAIVLVAVLTSQPIEQIKEPFYGVVMGLIGFYFGQKTSSTTNNPSK